MISSNPLGLRAAALALGLAAASCSRGATARQDARVITTDTLATLIRAGTPMVLFDARTGSHDDGRRIPGATSMAPDASAEEIARAGAVKNGLVVTYCLNPQCPNYAVLAAHLEALGYANVLRDPEGIEGWTKAGKPVVRDPGAGSRQP